MRAARWDTVWEAGGLWTRVLRWRLGTGPDAPYALLGEARMELWPASLAPLAGPPDPPAITIVGVLAGDSLSVTFSRTSAQTLAAAETGQRRYRHRVLVHDPDVDDDRVLLRGFVIVGPSEASP